MTARHATLLGIGTALTALGIVEAVALVNKEEGDTISAISHGAATRYPVLLGLGACVLAHFATPTRRPGEVLPLWQGATLAAVSGAALGLTWPRYDRSNPT